MIITVLLCPRVVIPHSSLVESMATTHIITQQPVTLAADPSTIHEARAASFDLSAVDGIIEALAYIKDELLVLDTVFVFATPFIVAVFDR